MDLTCPKCHGTMRTYERNGVHVDQCSECRGIFLDRGELDRLIDAENDWHGGAAQPEERREAEPRRAPEHSGSGYSSGHQPAASGAGLGAVVGEVLRQVQGSKSHSSHSSHSSDPYYKKRKKESFLGDLFG
jgi:Zn-finger nucleic acid-binding protein